MIYITNLFLKLNLFLLIDSYQYEMESNYHENSNLTDIFSQNKFFGWFLLFLIFFSIFTIFIFQYLEWESKDNPKNK